MRFLFISLIFLSSRLITLTVQFLDINSHLSYANEQDYSYDELNDIDTNADLTEYLQDESADEEYSDWMKCDKDISPPQGITRYLDIQFLKKLVRNLNFFSRPRLEMHLYLFKREFPDCGKELIMGDVKSILESGINPSIPTRILIHGWMGQTRGTFNRIIKDAYLQKGDFNVIVADWSANSANINYFYVVKLVESLGAYLALFTKYLSEKAHLNYDDIYLIGHSLGAQIAGAAGKRSWPNRFKTIFALDPAGPKFRMRSTDLRIDPTDAIYVESIQTSRNLGLTEPTGNASFYPSYGVYQKKCFYIGCSHMRAYRLFAESINSIQGFYGIKCYRGPPEWECDYKSMHCFKMGGEPATPKSGTFYLDTNSREPYAMGKKLLLGDCRKIVRT